MQKLLVWLSIVLVVVFGGKYLWEQMDRGAYENSASTRVEAYLENMKPGGDFEKAFNMWLMGGQSGLGNITQDQYNMYVAEINAWMQKRGLGNRIKSYQMGATTLVRGRDGLEPAVVDVACTIDGKPVVIHAVEGKPLSWAD